MKIIEIIIFLISAIFFLFFGIGATFLNCEKKLFTKKINKTKVILQ